VINRWIYIGVFSLFGIVSASMMFPVALLIVVLILLCLVLRREVRVGIGCLIAFLLFGFLYDYQDSHNETSLSAQTSSFTGKLISTPTINGDRLTTLLHLTNGEKLYLSYKITSEFQKQNLLKLRSRTTCSFSGELQIPQEARNFYSFDFNQYLYRQKIHWMVTPDSFSYSSCQDDEMTNLDRFQRYRDNALLYIKDTIPSPLDGFVQALIFGNRGLIEEDVLTAYQQLGLIHLLAISGMHVGLICSFIYLALVRIGITKEKVIALMMLLLPIYVVLAGGAPSVVRAAIMTFLILFKLRFRFFPLTSLDLISVAFIVMAIYNPYYVFNVGFQLSFTVSLALILSSQTLLVKLNHPLTQLIAASTIAQISSTPLILYHFYQFSLLSIPLNLLYVPVLTLVILPLCFFIYIMLLLNLPFVSLVSTVSNGMLNILNNFAIFITSHDWHIIVLGKPNILISSLYFVTILFTFIRLEQGKFFTVTSFIPLACALSFHWFVPYLNQSGEITILDVGQGESIVIELPFRKEVYLIDTGGTVTYDVEKWKQKTNNYSIGKDVVVPYLRAKGIRKINKLILTHPDTDHIGEAGYLLEHVNITELLIGEYHENNELEKRVINIAKEKKVSVIKVKSGDSWKVSGIPFNVLAPIHSSSNKNDGSIVLTAFLGGMSWLFTGDLEKEGEEVLIKKYPRLAVDVLKVAHHGSNSSTTIPFLKVLQPKYALISAGYQNQFGHPHPDVITRLNEQKVNTFRTDQQGAIRLIFSKDRSGTFHTKLPYDRMR
jgi:competence protein ComEC